MAARSPQGPGGHRAPTRWHAQDPGLSTVSRLRARRSNAGYGESVRSDAAVRGTGGGCHHGGQPAVTYYFSTRAAHRERRFSFVGRCEAVVVGARPLRHPVALHRWTASFSAGTLDSASGTRQVREREGLKRGVSPRVVPLVCAAGGSRCSPAADPRRLGCATRGSRSCACRVAPPRGVARYGLGPVLTRPALVGRFCPRRDTGL